MSIGMLFYVIALIFFFMAGIGQVMPTLTAIAWGLFSLTLGMLLSGVVVPINRNP